jgi:uncharacterized membrane protein
MALPDRPLRLPVDQAIKALAAEDGGSTFEAAGLFGDSGFVAGDTESGFDGGAFSNGGVLGGAPGNEECLGVDGFREGALGLAQVLIEGALEFLGV